MPDLPLTKSVMVGRSDLRFATGPLCEEPAPYGIELLSRQAEYVESLMFFPFGHRATQSTKN